VLFSIHVLRGIFGSSIHQDHRRSCLVTPLARGSGSGGTGKLPFSTTDLNNGDPEIKHHDVRIRQNAMKIGLPIFMLTYMVSLGHKHTAYENVRDPRQPQVYNMKMPAALS